MWVRIPNPLFSPINLLVYSQNYIKNVIIGDSVGGDATCWYYSFFAIIKNGLFINYIRTDAATNDTCGIKWWGVGLI